MPLYVIDPIHVCNVAAFSDVGFAWDVATCKSATGVYVAIVGPNTWAPTAGACKSQPAVIHSATESDILALDFVLRSEGTRHLAVLRRASA